MGNEKGEILQCILTTSESSPSLQAMADGLVKRYQDASVDPPVALYTDRDCCHTRGGLSKYNQLFSAWDGLIVHLDIFHFLRRFAMGATSESHPLYAVLMSRLSACIFEWDSGDVERLYEAKRGQLMEAGIKHPSESAVKNSVTKQELAKHCRRRTRGAQRTTEMIEALLLELSTATDTLGVPLLKPEIQHIWDEQKRHVSCIQDLPGISLYCRTGFLNKGGVRLPVFRCARGSSSLESFHLHLARFIPGNYSVVNNIMYT